MATYAIGDIQGCYNSFMSLLDVMDFDQQKDKLWLLGDLVNRGPHSLQVLEYAMSLEDRAMVILGNHDFYLLAVYYEVWPIRPTTTLQEVLASPKVEEIIDWLRHKPLIHVDNKLGYAAIHAGLYPGWTLNKAKQLASEVQHVLAGNKIADFLDIMYGNNPNKWNEKLTHDDRLRFIVNAMTRMRYVTEDLHLNLHHKEPIGDAPEYLIPWFNHPKLALPKDIKLLFGHWASLQGSTNKSNIIAMDTGCVWGERLTAMRLEDGVQFSVPLQD